MQFNLVSQLKARLGHRALTPAVRAACSWPGHRLDCASDDDDDDLAEEFLVGFEDGVAQLRKIYFKPHVLFHQVGSQLNLFDSSTIVFGHLVRQSQLPESCDWRESPTQEI